MAFRRSGSLKGENEAAASRGQSFSPVGQHKPAIRGRCRSWRQAVEFACRFGAQQNGDAMNSGEPRQESRGKAS